MGYAAIAMANPLFDAKNDIKRWMPAALFVIATNTLIIDVGVTLKLWETRENVFPLNEMISYVYGALPVGAMWILKYTYGRFWSYVAAQTMGSLLDPYSTTIIASPGNIRLA